MSLTPAEMDFTDGKHAAAREIALAFGVPPQLLGVPGDATYANYREANAAFWRHTVVPLVERAARAMTGWLGAKFPGARIAPDLDAVPALSAERDALWARLEGASFLSLEERRRLAGLEGRHDRAAQSLAAGPPGVGRPDRRRRAAGRRRPDVGRPRLGPARRHATPPRRPGPGRRAPGPAGGTGRGRRAALDRIEAKLERSR
jgi:hypothetical protein